MKALTLISSAVVLTTMIAATAPYAEAKGKPAQAGKADTTQPTSQPPAASLSCTTGSVTSNPLAGGSSVSYSQCLNPVRGNDVSADIHTDLATFLNQSLGEGWVFDSKYENGQTSAGPSNYGFSWVQNGDGSGTWSAAKNINSPFVISLKAGNHYSSYYFDGSAPTLGGAWATFDMKDLSHASLFVAKTVVKAEPKTTVPEPAGVASLILFGLMTIGFGKKANSNKG
jgi:hypothetical protein